MDGGARPRQTSTMVGSGHGSTNWVLVSVVGSVVVVPLVLCGGCLGLAALGSALDDSAEHEPLRPEPRTTPAADGRAVPRDSPAATDDEPEVVPVPSSEAAPTATARQAAAPTAAATRE